MNTRCAFLALLFGLSCAPVAIVAQGNSQSQNNGNGAGNSADAEWNALQDVAKPKNLPAPAANTPAAFATVRAQAIKSYVDDADRLKDFYTKNPGHAQAKEAKREEALLLVRAWQLGDDAHDQRRNALVTDVRHDASLPSAARSEVAALSDHVGVAKQTQLTGDARMLAYENVVRGLTNEFPDLPDGYEAMLQVAKHSSDAKAQSLAFEVLGMGGTPAATKAHAKVLVNRFALVGRPARTLARPILGAASPIERAAGQTTILYSWSTLSPDSVALARQVKAKAPPGAVIIGVNLDERDLTPAKQFAEAQHLPGEQLYDWMGRKGEIPQLLQMVEPGLVYVVDAAGTIRSVSAHRDLVAAFAAVGQR